MADRTTQSGGRDNRFPTTSWSIIRGAARPDDPGYGAAVETLARRYWRPVYAYIRRRWNKPVDEAKDLTQEFFLGLTERNALEGLAPDAGRFRSYVMAALDNLARLEHRRRNRRKRGGGQAPLSLEAIEGFEPAAAGTPEELFRQEWIRSLLQGALREIEDEYRARGDTVRFEIFRAREIDPPRPGEPTYADLAGRFQLSVGEVKNILYVARLHFRRKLLELVRQTVSDEEEAREEMKDLFGTDRE